MTMTEDAPAVPTSAGGNPIGFGRMLRKEDVRFVRGKGNYIDDINLPGMLHHGPRSHCKD
jgi:aerobic carbon-monoxide dehydrogenase large subunit